MAKYTKQLKRHHTGKHTRILSQKYFIESYNMLPARLTRILNKYKIFKNSISKSSIKIEKSISNKSKIIFNLKPSSGDQPILIGNRINGITSIIQDKQDKVEKHKASRKLYYYFKKYFTLDYMNYIDYDIDKRKYSFSSKIATFKKEDITLEASLIIILNKSDNYTKFDSHMLDKIKIITQNNEYDFPDNFPDNFSESISESFLKVYEIISQVFTILKYLAIIIGHNTTKPDNITHAFKIITVRMKLYEDLNVILDSCFAKNDWTDSRENDTIYQWLDYVLFIPYLGNQEKPAAGLSTVSLYKFNYDKLGHVPRPEISAISVAHNKLGDFRNKFIIVSSDFITKVHTDLEYKFLIGYLKKYNLEMLDLYSSVGVPVSFMWYGYDETPRRDIIIQHYNTPAYLGNAIESLDNINNKDVLFALMKHFYPNEYRKFMAESFLLHRKTVLSGDKIYIARPITEIDPITKKKKLKAFSGRDIIYIENQKTLDKAKRLLDKYDNILLSEYIMRPLLFTGRKFHLRIYVLITYIDSVVKTYLFDKGYIWTAKLPFKRGDWNNMEIHDSHYKSTDGDPIFPDDFTSKNIGRNIMPEEDFYIMA